MIVLRYPDSQLQKRESESPTKRDEVNLYEPGNCYFNFVTDEIMEGLYILAWPAPADKRRQRHG
jgi:hypothetical protein